MSKLFPDAEWDSVYDIDFHHLYLEGFRAIIFDIDNTIVPHGAPADQKAIDFFGMLHREGLKTCLLSNNKEKRVRPFALALQSPYISKAGKPGISGYEEAMRIMGSSRKDTLFIGDQIFTDIWGAKRAGLRSYLVRPINPREEIQIVFKRYLEAPVLFFFRKKKKKTLQKANR
ncbi:MAG: HAD-IIIA family hydrolase [Johnsonella sp.]|nr:HAD-IIIA family hydrolase [Johnsonella sp.]